MGFTWYVSKSLVYVVLYLGIIVYCFSAPYCDKFLRHVPTIFLSFRWHDSFRTLNHFKILFTCDIRFMSFLPLGYVQMNKSIFRHYLHLFSQASCSLFKCTEREKNRMIKLTYISPEQTNIMLSHMLFISG